MRRKKVLWLLVTALVVAGCALLPEAVLRVQDVRLERDVQTQDVGTVDLELVTELSLEDTLYLVQNVQSRVTLERGRELTEQEASDDAVRLLSELFLEQLGNYVTVTTTHGTPQLFVGEGGESVVLWQVDVNGSTADPAATGYGIYPPWANEWYDPGDRPFAATILIDERRGRAVGMRMRWNDIPTADPAPTEGPYPTPGSAAEDMLDPAAKPMVGWDDISAEAAFQNLRATLMYAMFSDLIQTDYPFDGDLIMEEDSLVWYVTTSTGVRFTVPSTWDMEQIAVNPWDG